MKEQRPRSTPPRNKAERPSAPAPDPFDSHLALLKDGQISSAALMPEGSNYTFLVGIKGGSGESCQAIYKPQAGERPLWDFPRGTLYKRERATYVISRALGWPLVPPTIVREGPHGVGSLQLYVECEQEANYFTLAKDRLDDFCKIALFDLLANNADRKAGHCLLGRDGRIWVIDHGLTFHAVFKLRTVIWDFCGQPIPKPLLENVETFLAGLSASDGMAVELSKWLSADEIEALKHRGRILLDNPVFPELDPRRNIPWPWF